MRDTISIRGTAYTLFSCERADMGGLYSKKEAVRALKDAGIKVSTNPNYCYTIYVGHFALLVEAKYRDEASNILFGTGA